MDNDLQRASMRCGSTSGRLAIGMLLIIAGTMEPVRAAVSDDRPLLGGSLTWAINRDFKTGRAGTRQVELTLKTAWRIAPTSAQKDCVPAETVSTCTQDSTEESMARCTVASITLFRD